LTGPRVIVALDFAEAAEALGFAARVPPSECGLKVGLELFTAAGPEIVDALVQKGFEVFLDLKFHDIPHTVARACTRAAALGVWMLTVHTLGGAAMLAAARAAIDASRHRPQLIGVTLLTAHAPGDMTALGFQDGVDTQVERLAALAQAAALDGVVCAPTEAADLRRRFGRGFLLITPGIRPPGAAADDQSRTLTPREACASGADYLVVGRPITRASDPIAALAAINREIQGI
jgi:orotidine-5'-phosphate decarboxylase